MEFRYRDVRRRTSVNGNEYTECKIMGSSGSFRMKCMLEYNHHGYIHGHSSMLQRCDNPVVGTLLCDINDGRDERKELKCKYPSPYSKQ